MNDPYLNQATRNEKSLNGGFVVLGDAEEVLGVAFEVILDDHAAFQVQTCHVEVQNKDRRTQEQNKTRLSFKTLRFEKYFRLIKSIKRCYEKQTFYYEMTDYAIKVKNKAVSNNISSASWLKKILDVIKHRQKERHYQLIAMNKFT